MRNVPAKPHPTMDAGRALPRFEGTPLVFSVDEPAGRVTRNRHVRWFAKQLQPIFGVYHSLWPGPMGGANWSRSYGVGERPYVCGNITMILPKADAWEVYSRLSALRDGLKPQKAKKPELLADLEQPAPLRRGNWLVAPPRGSVTRLEGFDEVFALVRTMHPSISKEQLEQARYRRAGSKYDSDDSDSDDGYTLLCTEPAEPYLVPGPEVDPNLAFLDFNIYDDDLTDDNDQWDGTGDALLAAMTLFKL